MKQFLKFMIKFFIPLLILGAGFAGFNYLKSTKEVPTPKPPEERSWNVSALQAELKPVQAQFKLYGSLIAARSVDLRALVAGEVVEVSENLQEGAEVIQGEVLLVIDPFEYEAAMTERRASLLEARAKLDEFRAKDKSDRLMLARDREILELDEKNVTRSEKLKKKGNISDRALDTAITTLNRQKQTVEQRESQLKIQQAKITQQQAVISRLEVNLKRAERDLRNTQLKAPFSGYLENITAELGKRVDNRDQVASLVDSKEYEVKFQLPGKSYGSLLSTPEKVIGRKVKIVWTSSGEKYAFDGTIKRIGSQIVSDTGGIEIFAVLDPSESLKLIRPGAFVEVHAPGPVFDNSVLVPEQAVFEDKYVYVIEESRLVKRAIQIEFQQGVNHIITGNLKSGDKILTTRFAEVGPGILVEVR